MSNFWNNLTGLGKGIFILAGAAVLLGGTYVASEHIPALGRVTTAASVPDQVAPISGPAQPGPVAAIKTAVSLPSASIANVGGCQVELWTIPWNATTGLQFANGGVTTTKGSLMEKHGVNLKLVVQDDYGKMQESMLKFAEGVKRGDNCPTGAAFVIIMGDGYAGFAPGLVEAMSKIKQGPEVVTAVGYSSGEDKCMLPYQVALEVDENGRINPQGIPSEWIKERFVDPKDGKRKFTYFNPQKARGSVIGAVMRDGDYNICVTWAAQNGIPINPDEKTYDPNAMNFFATSSFNDADNAVISGSCEPRPEVVNGKKTGKTVQACVNGTATWTPGDVNVARKKGGLAAVASTKEYAYQMPSIVIGNRDFNARNPKLVEGLIQAALEGSEAVRSDEKALDIGAQVSAQVYGQENAAYWKKYYKGIVENDAQGVPISLGGSRTAGFADNAFLFGLNGNDNLFKRIYKQFGDHNAKYYPQLTPSYPAYESVVNTAYLSNVLQRVQVGAAAVAEAAPKFDAAKPIERVVAQRSYIIEFDTGKATLRRESIPVLEQMLNQIAITNLQVEVRGHTDNVGSQESNLRLSRARADAVKGYLMANAPSGFPEERVRTRGYGDAMPVSENSSERGRAQNRRVEVILGTSGN